jgi:hypothetical protein
VDASSCSVEPFRAVRRSDVSLSTRGGVLSHRPSRRLLPRGGADTQGDGRTEQRKSEPRKERVSSAVEAHAAK